LFSQLVVVSVVDDDSSYFVNNLVILFIQFGHAND